jgi:ribosomal protein S1
MNQLFVLLIVASLCCISSFGYTGATTRPRALFKLASTTEFTDFAVGQEFDGKLVSALAFGVFVDIDKGTNVLLPRSVLSKGNYEKLKSMVESKEQEKIKIKV